MSWTLAEAKADLEGVATKAQNEGPQEIEASDGTRFRLSMVPADDGKAIKDDKPTLIEFLLASSWVGLSDEDAELINDRSPPVPSQPIDFD